MKPLQPEPTTREIVEFLQTTFAAAGFSRAVIALSGGIDSATSCALAVRALGAGNVYPLLLPYGELNSVGVRDAREVIASLKIPTENVAVVDIQPLLASFFERDRGMDQLRKGNAMARMRMMVVFDYAKKLPGLVVGTENKSEHLLGYYTRFGDEASDIEPIRTLYKTQVYQLAEYLGLPDTVRTKAPTAGLWEGQTDEGEFGFTYADADEIFFLLNDEKKPMDEVVKRFPKATIEAVLSVAAKNDFKHKLPYSL